MDTVVIHALNALLYASVLFLIAGGLSLIYGVMRIVNLAHGNLYAFGAYVSAWVVGLVVAHAQADTPPSTILLLLLLPAGAVAAAAFGAAIYPTYNFLVIAVGGLAAVFLWAFIYKTRFGVVLRATSQDMRMASALGVNVNRVYVQAFTLGCLMAGLGGAIIVPSQSAVLGMGVDALILSFIVVVVGGLGSLEGALLGALIVGGVLLIRPAGLFGRA